MDSLTAGRYYQNRPKKERKKHENKNTRIHPTRIPASDVGNESERIIRKHARIRRPVRQQNRHSAKDLTMYTTVQKRKVIQELQAILAEPNARTAAQHRLYQLRASLLATKRKAK